MYKNITFYRTYYDIDKNGAEELLIAVTSPEEEEKHIVCVYNADGSKVTEVTEHSYITIRSTGVIEERIVLNPNLTDFDFYKADTSGAFVLDKETGVDYTTSIFTDYGTGAQYYDEEYANYISDYLGDYVGDFSWELLCESLENSK